MKPFRERLKLMNEGVTKVTLQSGEVAIGVKMTEPDKVKTLLNMFDWYGEMIDDMTKHRKVMAANHDILKQLRDMGVDIISNPGYVGPTGKKGREINLKLIKESEEMIAAFAEKTGKSVSEVEGLWNKAKKIAVEEGREEDYAYITGILKKMLSLNENDEEGDDSLDVFDAIMSVMVFGLQTHVYHILTKKYAEHVAIGEFYDDITKDADGLAEMYIGMGGEMSRYDAYDIELSIMYDKESFVDELHEFREVVTSAISITNEPSLMSLNGIFVDLQSDVDELLYKLTLN